MAGCLTLDGRITAMKPHLGLGTAAVRDPTYEVLEYLTQPSGCEHVPSSVQRAACSDTATQTNESLIGPVCLFPGEQDCCGNHQSRSGAGEVGQDLNPFSSKHPTSRAGKSSKQPGNRISVQPRAFSGIRLDF